MSAPAAGEGRLVGAALRCYPARWRRRHAGEAAELAALLIGDGRPAASIAWSYLAGAAREWLTPRAGRVRRKAAGALLAAACLLGFSAALVAETVPAKAASTSQPGPVAPKVRPAASGSPRQLVPCRPGAPRQLNIEGTAHARSC